ncbi:unnamed protein product [Calypogeia fissa]
MAVIEEHSDGEGNEECSGGDAVEESSEEGICSLEIMSGIAVDDDDEEGNGDDDEDAVWGVGGLKGFVQRPEKPWTILRQYFPSKVGGCPAWLDPLNLPKGEHMLCGICDKPLQFLLQVYASSPEDEDYAFHRILFVFICPSLACLQQDELQQRKKGKRLRSVKVFRCQLPRDNPFYSSNPLDPEVIEPPLSDGAPLCSWCGTWKGDKICGGCKQTRYCSQGHQLDHWRGDHAPYCRRAQEKLKRVSSNAVEGPTFPSSDAETPGVAFPSNLWPEFELIVDEGEEDDLDDNLDSRTGAGRLLADYESLRRQGRDFSARDVQGVEESSAEEQQWALFQTKVSKSPEQVLWYLRSSDAKPLWPKLDGQPKPSDIPVCSLCGSERNFEFQILPQLLYFFGIQDNPDSLDWGTIAAYSCRQSCKIEGYCEEFAWVQPGFSCVELDLYGPAVQVRCHDSI